MTVELYKTTVIYKNINHTNYNIYYTNHFLLKIYLKCKTTFQIYSKYNMYNYIF